MNTTQLNSLGGKLFNEWYKAECLGESSAVIQRIDINELKVLLNSVSAYSIPLIHRLLLFFFIFISFNVLIKVVFFF